MTSSKPSLRKKVDLAPKDEPFRLLFANHPIPSLWFMVHSFYSLILLLAGIGVILFTAWHKRKLYRG